MPFIYVYQDLFAEEWGDFFQVLETPEVNFKVGDEKDNMPPKGGTQRGVVSHSLDQGYLLTKMVTL